MPGHVPTEWRVPISSPSELDRFLSRHHEAFLYRGQCNADWTLRPTIERGLEPQDANHVDVSLPLREKRIIIECRNRLAGLEPPLIEKNNVEWLNRIQHHGGKTRLLDVTSDPLIALWFALGDQMETFQHETAIAVWRIRTELVLETAREYLRSEPESDQFGQLLNQHLEIRDGRKPLCFNRRNRGSRSCRSRPWFHRPSNSNS